MLEMDFLAGIDENPDSYGLCSEIWSVGNIDSDQKKITFNAEDGQSFTFDILYLCTGLNANDNSSKE